MLGIDDELLFVVGGGFLCLVIRCFFYQRKDRETIISVVRFPPLMKRDRLSYYLNPRLSESSF